MTHDPRNPKQPSSRHHKPTMPESTAPLEVEADEEPIAHSAASPRNGRAVARHSDANHETSVDEHAAPRIDHSVMGSEAGHMSDILNWALDSIHEPAVAAADWLARDIDPDQPTATALLSDPQITLARIKQAKSVFKTMRIVGEKSADRRIGARMYAAAIAAGLVRHRKLISRQSYDALERGFQGLLDDHRMTSALRDLGGMALCVLKEGRFDIDAKEDRELPPLIAMPAPNVRVNVPNSNTGMPRR